jgi:hypothetical protein
MLGLSFLVSRKCQAALICHVSNLGFQESNQEGETARRIILFDIEFQLPIILTGVFSEPMEDVKDPWAIDAS